ncbi:hypothetical protein K0M31_001047 [Melipona bicolor]|uniref:Uncharacterized protein n=1 Tax=Melipona bicolor TaxID=60889 RepID=A0AA40GER2_9HYME|nr:hypothetical protein K0M31_001047 [Melipona bicolor]
MAWDIPRRQEFRAIKHSLSFDEPASSCVTPKGEPITADYAVVRLHAVTPAAHFKRDFLLADSESGLSFSLLFPTLVSELFRIIIFVSERYPRGSKLKLSFLAIAGRRERRRTERSVPRQTKRA